MYAKTVKKPVDRHVARLVDAINGSKFDVRTTGSCSSHFGKTGSPYVAFEAQGWEFIVFALRVITALNSVTPGQTRLTLFSLHGDANVGGYIRLGIYPWLWAGYVDWSPVIAESIPPPRRLVTLWWAELDALAEMIENSIPRVPAQAASEFGHAHAARSRRNVPPTLHPSESELRPSQDG